MKKFIILALVATVVIAKPASFYDADDNFNVDELIANDRLLKAYAHCFLGTGKCTPQGNNVKQYVADAISTQCSKCTDKQKTISAKAINAIKAKLPQEYDDLNKMYNPGDKYTKEYEDFLTKYGS